MAVYTEISDEELHDFVAGYDIGGVTACKGIAEGVENSNYLLQTDRGLYILTLYEKRVTPADLTITTTIEPINAAGDIGGTHFRLTVSARNPAANRVVVNLPPPSMFTSWSTGFSFRLSGAASYDYGEGALDYGMRVFASGETKRRVYDFVVAPSRTDAFTLAPGSKP